MKLKEPRRLHLVI